MLSVWHVYGCGCEILYTGSSLKSAKRSKGGDKLAIEEYFLCMSNLNLSRPYLGMSKESFRRFASSAIEIIAGLFPILQVVAKTRPRDSWGI